MGFIQAVAGAIGGTFADQWKDFLRPPQNVSPTAVVFPAEMVGQNAGRGSNTRHSENVISNGSRIVVPEGYGILTFQNGAITNLVAQPGAYEFSDTDPNARSLFAGDGILAPTLGTSWERFKFGGQPGVEHLVFYVSLKEIPNNRFGTQSPIYWDDRFLGTQVGARARGSYTLRVTDPILLVKSIVPAQYISANAPVFDLGDQANPVGDQLFNEVVGSLSAAFSRYVNDADKDHRITRIQSDAIGFAQALSGAVEDAYQWQSTRGIQIVSSALAAIEYDEGTLALLEDVKKADALAGARGDSFLRQAAARGIQGAGESGGGDGLAFMGMGMNAAANAMGGMFQQQPGQGYQAPAPQAPVPADPAPAQPAAAAAEDPMARLTQAKQMLDAGLITQADFDAVKNNVLGL